MERKILALILVVSCSCVNNEKDETANKDILGIIVGETATYSPEQDAFKDYDTCTMGRLRVIGLDVETSEAGINLFNQGLLKRGYEICSITSSVHDVLDVYGLNLIVGCCCLDVGATEIKVGYYGILSEDDQLLTFGYSYFIDSQTNKIITGCNDLTKQLATIKFQVRRQVSSVVCSSD